MKKMGKIVRTQCYCGRRYNKSIGDWYGATKEHAEADKKLAEQGLLDVKIVKCPNCQKREKDG